MTVAGNNGPQFIKQGDNQSTPLTSSCVNTSSEGGGTIGTSMLVLYTPGANDSYVEYIRFIPTASTASTNTTATTVRIYRSTVNSGSPTSANTFLIAEISLAAQTADVSTTAVNWIDLPINMRLAGSGSTTPEYLLVTQHVTPAANSQWVATCVGGDY
jgi:hypothetical protein